jgi:hypothetical protein
MFQKKRQSGCVQRFKYYVCAYLDMTQQQWSSHIWQITLWEDGNFVNFSDTDSSTDYFHSYNLGLNSVIEWINEGKGGDTIEINFGNNKNLPKYHKRVALIAKKCGYRAVDITEDKYYHDVWGKSDPRIWCEYKYKLFKNKEQSA